MPHEIVSFDDEAIKGYVGKLVAKTVEKTLNALLDEEAGQLVNAGRYERTEERQVYRSGHLCLVKLAFRFGTAVGILDQIHPTLPADPSPCGTAWGSCNPGRPLS